MPLYEYKNQDTGEIDVRFNAYEARDSEPAPWVRIPSRICVPGSASDRPLSDAEGFLKTMRVIEDREGGKFSGLCEFSADDVKRIWSDPRPTPTVEDYEIEKEAAADPNKGKSLYFV